MGFLDKLLRKEGAPEKSGATPEHAMIVHFSYESVDLSPLFALEERLEEAFATAGTGEYDGNTVGSGEGVLHMYGPDANALLETVRPILEAVDFMHGARVKLRYGPPSDGVREVDLVLGT